MGIVICTYGSAGVKAMGMVKPAEDIKKESLNKIVNSTENKDNAKKVI